MARHRFGEDRLHQHVEGDRQPPRRARFLFGLCDDDHVARCRQSVGSTPNRGRRHQQQRSLADQLFSLAATGHRCGLARGWLELHHTFERTTLSRGIKAIELGKTYDNRPQANDLSPDSDELADWGVDGTHLPDNSTQRSHPLNLAMACIDEFSGVASGAVRRWKAAAMSGEP